MLSNVTPIADQKPLNRIQGDRYGGECPVEQFRKHGIAYDAAPSHWFGLMILAGTPPAVMESLLNAAKAAHADPEVAGKS